MPEFGLSDSQKGLMVAFPLLGGAFLRLVLGLLTDHIGARRTGILGMALTTVPLLLGWLWADSFDKLLLVGLPVHGHQVVRQHLEQRHRNRMTAGEQRADEPAQRIANAGAVAREVVDRGEVVRIRTMSQAEDEDRERRDAKAGGREL